MTSLRFGRLDTYSAVTLRKSEKTYIFQGSLTIASACSKVLRKRLFKPQTIGLISVVGYSCNTNYSNKALMWLIYMEQTHGWRIMQARNGHEVWLPDLSKYSVDVYCKVTRTASCFTAVTITAVPARTSGTLRCWAGRLAKRYERNMSIIKDILSPGIYPCPSGNAHGTGTMWRTGNLNCSHTSSGRALIWRRASRSTSVAEAMCQHHKARYNKTI
jgi:hypothetical protein